MELITVGIAIVKTVAPNQDRSYLQQSLLLSCKGDISLTLRNAHTIALSKATRIKYASDEGRFLHYVAFFHDYLTNFEVEIDLLDREWISPRAADAKRHVKISWLNESTWRIEDSERGCIYDSEAEG